MNYACMVYGVRVKGVGRWEMEGGIYKRVLGFISNP